MGNQQAKHPYKFKENKDLLGQGAFGKTFRAQKKGGPETFAIHYVYKDGSFADASTIMSAAGAVIRLSNFCKHLISCVDFYDDKAGYYIVMEWCSHRDLGRYLKEVKPFNITRIDLICQALEGVLYLHSQTPAILHGHLKPENVLIHADGYKDIVKITDFGFTVALPTCESFSKFYLQKDKGMFSPPEYFIPSGKFSPAVDVFSLGLVHYVTITHSGDTMGIFPKTDRHERFSIDYTSFPLGKLMTRDVSQSDTSYTVVSPKADDTRHVREIVTIINDMLRPRAEDRAPLTVVKEQLQCIAEELSIRPRDADSISIGSARSLMSRQTPTTSRQVSMREDINPYLTPPSDYEKPSFRYDSNEGVKEPLYVEPITGGSPVPPGSPPPRSSIVRVQVMYDYAPERQDELRLRAGDTITVFKRNPSGWWEGELRGVRGLFPANFVEEIVLPKPPVPPQRDNLRSAQGKWKYTE